MNARVTLALILMIGLAPTGRAAAQGVGSGPPVVETVEAPPLGPREPTPAASPAPLTTGGGQLPRRGKLVMLSKKRGS